MITVYGISNCDSVKKARKWLQERGVEYIFHDFRKDGISVDMINKWLDQIEWQNCINKKSTTWKQLSDVEKARIDEQKDISLLIDRPTLIKRPVLSYNDQYIVGFDDSTYTKILT